jgi:hypothetical protein
MQNLQLGNFKQKKDEIFKLQTFIQNCKFVKRKETKPCTMPNHYWQKMYSITYQVMHGGRLTLARTAPG